ncbi:DUF2542 family protein, partial [Salmonella enterica subsp. enterica serovar Typhimurium]
VQYWSYLFLYTGCGFLFTGMIILFIIPLKLRIVIIMI